MQESNITIDANNNCDIDSKKLANLAEGTDYSDAITKHQLDSATIDKHDNN